MPDVKTSWISIALSPDGRPTGDMDAYLALPPSGHGPGIVMLQEIFGVNTAMRAKAEDLAAAGYVVVVPDLFWRLQRRVDLGYGEADRQQGFGFMKQFDMAGGAADAADAALWLATQPACSGKIGFVGFCLGGKVAVLAAARTPDVAAVVSFYGVKLEDNMAELASLRAPFQFHVGDKDAHIPAAGIDKVRAAVAERPGAAVHVYPGAQHGFFNRLRGDVYDEAAARLATGRMMQVLAGMRR
jgi:carboxymethylenebutenolidase